MLCKVKRYIKYHKQEQMATAHLWRSDAGEIERELYKRARDATKEAQREGDAQLQAAVAAAATSPVREVQQPVLALTERSTWSLKFSNPRLEKAYERKSTTNAECNDSIPTGCELAFCIFQIWLELQASHKSQPRESPSSFMNLRYTFNHLYGHICSAAVSALVLIFQIGLLKWYKSNRGFVLWHYVWMLWIWESLKLFFTEDVSAGFSASLAFVQCILISLIYQVAFCMHLRLRIYAFCCQILATISRGKLQGVQVLLLSIITGHLVGLMLAYRLDLRARTIFVQSLPKYLVDSSTGNGHRASFSRKMWSILYPDLFEKSEPTNHAGSIFSEQSAPRRALGGFAGGFGGVSGLKCANLTTAAPLSSSSNSLGGQELSDSSSDDEDFLDSGFSGSQNPHGPGKSSQVYIPPGRMSQLSTSSACSNLGPDQNQSIKFQAQRRRGF